MLTKRATLTTLNISSSNRFWFAEIDVECGDFNLLQSLYKFIWITCFSSFFYLVAILKVLFRVSVYRRTANVFVIAV